MAAADRIGRATLAENIAMKINVLLFGILKELLGGSAEKIELRDGARAREVLVYYSRKAPQFESMIPSLAISVNREYAEADRA